MVLTIEREKQTNKRNNCCGHYLKDKSQQMLSSSKGFMTLRLVDTISKKKE